MDPASILGTIPVILDLINKAFKGKETADVAAIKQRLFALHTDILQMQSSQVLLMTENANLKNQLADTKREQIDLMKQIAESNQWDSEKAKYEARKLASGTTIYRLKNTEEYFCPRCFVERSAIHLQPSPKHADHINYCPKCQNTFEISKIDYHNDIGPRPHNGY